jgi:catechol 2,3-dioxygenase-like lactoylglutathione lyase family enzyme
MTVVAFDHVAIPTAKPEQMLEFYRALGFSAPTLEEWRASKQLFFSIQLGENKINVHAPSIWQNPGFTLRGHTARPGCGDFCFVWSGTVEDILAKLREVGARIEEGPVERVGGRDHGTAVGSSVYTRDPDDNLLEFIVYRGAP